MFSDQRRLSISFWIFLRPSGSSMPPAMDASLPKMLASPCHATLVPSPRAKIEAGADGDLAAHGGALSFIERAMGRHGLGQLHLDFGRAANVADADAHLHREVRRVLHRHALEIRQQRAKLVGVGEEVVDLFRTARRAVNRQKI